MTSTHTSTRLVATASASVLALLLVACSSSPHSSSTGRPARAVTGPAAVLSGPITGGAGKAFLGSAATSDLAAAGYIESEFFADGTAQSLQAGGPSGQDGRWSVQPKNQAAYRTRIVVRLPLDKKRFNGTLLVEWLNVSGGVDAAPDFTYMSTELLRSGYGWVGVSAQQIGVSGGTGVVAVPGVPTGGLRGIDAARYGSLNHPGDAYALDIFSQIGRALRAPDIKHPQVDPLGGLKMLRLAAVGESQSAFELTTYVNAIQPSADVFDGFFVHSRGGGAIPIEGGIISSGIIGGIRIRDDVGVPVFLFETETDEASLRYYDARQPDTAKIRLWDVAGAAHADAYIVGGAAAMLGCKSRINEAPTHYVVAAALEQFDRWMRTGAPPDTAPRMEVIIDKGSPVIGRDPSGNALGGLRTPSLDVPVAAYTGVAGDASNILCFLFGGTRLFGPAELAKLYPSTSAYVSAFEVATDMAIKNGHILAADRTQLIAEASKLKF